MKGMDATKSRLLESAGEEFAERGYEAATVRAICDRAKANIAAINYHYGDKQGLYVAAVLEAHRCGMEGWGMDEPTEELREALRMYIRHFMTHVLSLREEGWRQRLMLRELSRPTIALEILVRDAIRPRFEALLSILRRIDPTWPEATLWLIAFSIIGQCLHYRMGAPVNERLIGKDAVQGLDLEMLTDHITRFSLAALGLDSPLSRLGSEVAAHPATSSMETKPCLGSL